MLLMAICDKCLAVLEKGLNPLKLRAAAKNHSRRTGHIVSLGLKLEPDPRRRIYILEKIQFDPKQEARELMREVRRSRPLFGGRPLNPGLWYDGADQDPSWDNALKIHEEGRYAERQADRLIIY